MAKITAAILIIGNEILSGRTQDLNVQYIASGLARRGIYLEEVRIVPDIKERIIEAVKSLSASYTYLLTTGGIGPTHDDITSDAIAEAFGVSVEKNQEAYKRIEEYYHTLGREVNTASAKMAYIPSGASLIDNSQTNAPGFIIGNVYVMAGIPKILQVMFDWLLHQLDSGPAIESRQINVEIGESKLAAEFEQLQNKYPIIEMGSYPFIHEGRHATTLVLRSENKAILDNAFEDLKAMTHKFPLIS